VQRNVLDYQKKPDQVQSINILTTLHIQVQIAETSQKELKKHRDARTQTRCEGQLKSRGVDFVAKRTGPKLLIYTV
jgi:hypothetical protein